MKLKSKILLSYGLALGLVVLVGGWGITNLRRLGRASQAILEENYNSILAAENTIDALERQDSAVLLFLLENRDRGSQQFRQNQIEFLKWLGRAEGNITIPGEAEIIAEIEQSYEDYLDAFFQLETLGDFDSAIKNYRVAISLDPTYQLAKSNLDRATRNSDSARPRL